jgi:hypothetical protein
VNPPNPAAVDCRGPVPVPAPTSRRGQVVAGSGAPTFDRARGNQAYCGLRCPVSWRVLDGLDFFRFEHERDAQRSGGRFALRQLGTATLY